MLTAVTSVDLYPEAMQFLESGITFYLSVPGNLEQIHQLRHPCNPGPIGNVPRARAAEKGFEETSATSGLSSPQGSNKNILARS